MCERRWFNSASYFQSINGSKLGTYRISVVQLVFGNFVEIEIFRPSNQVFLSLIYNKSYTFHRDLLLIYGLSLDFIRWFQGNAQSRKGFPQKMFHSFRGICLESFIRLTSWSAIITDIMRVMSMYYLVIIFLITLTFINFSSLTVDS